MKDIVTIRCYYLSFLQFRRFSVDGAGSVYKRALFFCRTILVMNAPAYLKALVFLVSSVSLGARAIENNAVWWQIFESIYLVKQKAERCWDNNTVLVPKLQKFAKIGVLDGVSNFPPKIITMKMDW